MSKSLTPRIFPRNPTPADMSKEWRVWFKYYDVQKRKHVIISRRGTLVDCKTFKDRLAQAHALVDLLNERLSKGWNPITNTYPEKTVDEQELEVLRAMTFAEAMDYAYKKKIKDWSHKSAQDYKSVIKYLKEALPETKELLHISSFKKRDFKLLLESVCENQRLGNGGFNKYRSMLSGLISELVEWDVLEYNPIRDIKTKQIKKTFANRPPTQDERTAIVKRIKGTDFYRFICVVYGCGIRPKEIIRMKIKHLHKLQNVFRLTSDITKTGNERDAFIPGWLMELLSELNLHKYSPEDYLFGKGFRPGPKSLSVNRSHMEWNRIVKAPVEKGGLGIDVNLYGLKKLSGDDMVKIQRKEGVLDLLQIPQMQFGHEDREQTKVYVNAHKELIKEVIVNHMPKLDSL